VSVVSSSSVVTIQELPILLVFEFHRRSASQSLQAIACHTRPLTPLDSRFLSFLVCPS
jgi:hypothetical protein